MPETRIEALCRLLEAEGHMTPIATRQIVRAYREDIAAFEATPDARLGEDHA